MIDEVVVQIQVLKWLLEALTQGSLSVGLLRGSFRGSDTVAEPDGHNLYTLIIIEYYY